MKHLVTIIVSLIIACIAVIAWHGFVRAQSTPMTDAHIERIRANCVGAQSILTQLHTSDGGLRVNRGQRYESLFTKLMLPFNSRVVLNKYDGTKLIAIASKYEGYLTEFRESYKVYEEALSRALKINCLNEPVAFYDSVTEARSKRILVHQNVLKLHQTIQDYKAEFELFAGKLEEEKP